MLRKIKASFVRCIAASHIVGPDLSDGLCALQRAHAGGWETTLSRWEPGDESPEQIAGQYRTALNAIGTMRHSSKFSIKPAALRFDFVLFKEVLQVAKNMGIPLQFDAEHPQYASRSIALFERSYCEYENIGYTLPARWKRSFVDAERIIAMQAPVRLVKGQWDDPETPCENVRHQFLHLANRFIGKKNTVLVATHDSSLAEKALDQFAVSQTPCELEQMFGLPWMKGIGAGMFSVVKRMYIPYGHPYLPYNYSFVMERPHIAGWMMRDFFLRREGKKQSLKRQAAEPRQAVNLKNLVENHFAITPTTVRGKQ